MYKDAIDLALKSGKGYSVLPEAGSSLDDNFADMELHIVREDAPDTSALEQAVAELG